MGDDALADQLSASLIHQRDVITARRQLWAPAAEKGVESKADDAEYIDSLMGDLRSGWYLLVSSYISMS